MLVTNIRLLAAGGVMTLIFGITSNAEAVAVDLTSSISGIINGATFVFDKLQPTGTGVLNPFVRIQGNGTEQGYNTTVANNSQLPFQETFGVWTHDLKFSSLQATDGNYLFVLDIGEPVSNNTNNGQQSLLSLDGLKFYKTTTPGQNSSSVDAAGNANGISGTLLYNMDGVEDSYVLLDANRDGNPGNGVSDMLLKVPESVFTGVGPDDYIILWSRFGLQQASDAGSESFGTFEEWSHVTGPGGGGGGGGGDPVPEPGTLILVGVGLAGLAFYRRKMQ